MVLTEEFHCSLEGKKLLPVERPFFRRNTKQFWQELLLWQYIDSIWSLQVRWEVTWKVWKFQLDILNETGNYCSYGYIHDSKSDFFFNQKVLIVFLFLHGNICCGYSYEAPHWGASYEYPQHMFSWRNKKNIYSIPFIKTSQRHFIWIPTTSFHGEIRKIFTRYSFLSRTMCTV